jgi:hypothetical protein
VVDARADHALGARAPGDEVAEVPIVDLEERVFASRDGQSRAETATLPSLRTMTRLDEARRTGLVRQLAASSRDPPRGRRYRF